MDDHSDLPPPAAGDAAPPHPPAIPSTLPEDETYFLLLSMALDVCAYHKPKFGRGGAGVDLDEFQSLYGADPFYHWVGLDSPLIYAAHKAAGGMTSVYRQLGTGCQWILNRVLQDHLGLTEEEANWSYEAPSLRGGTRRLSLDGRIDLAHVKEPEARQRVRDWMNSAAERLLIPEETRSQLKGVVIEARQGYKSKDSKRQNADISNASNAYVHLYLPVVLLFSNQIDNDVALRYTEAQWLLLRGAAIGTATDSTYAFLREIVRYDLGAFFERNSPRIRDKLEKILKALLSAG